MGSSEGSQPTRGDRPSYNQAQLAQYVEFIHPDPTYSLATLQSEIKQDPLAALTVLQLRQNCATIWGNVALHYSQHRALPLDADALFHKIVERRLGGYCMENNAFFSTVLRSLGFDLYVSGARISHALMGSGDPEGFAGWQHEVIIVTIDGQHYLVDVGLGSGSPTTPIPLTSASSQERESVPGSFVRLVHRAIAPNTTSQHVWVLELKNTTTNQWSAGYCFTEFEWLPQDFEILNYRTSRDPKSWFTYKLVLVRTLIDDETRTRPVGTIILTGAKVERRIGTGKKEVLVEAKSEAERVRALEQWFGVVLRPDEVRGIQSMPTEITGEELRG